MAASSQGVSCAQVRGAGAITVLVRFHAKVVMENWPESREFYVFSLCLLPSSEQADVHVLHEWSLVFFYILLQIPLAFKLANGTLPLGFGPQDWAKATCV